MLQEAEIIKGNSSVWLNKAVWLDHSDWGRLLMVRVTFVHLCFCADFMLQLDISSSSRWATAQTWSSCICIGLIASRFHQVFSPTKDRQQGRCKPFLTLPWNAVTTMPPWVKYFKTFWGVHCVFFFWLNICICSEINVTHLPQCLLLRKDLLMKNIINVPHSTAHILNDPV